MAKILLVEDDEELAENIRDWLSHERHLVEVVTDGREGFDRMQLYDYDVVVLDWGLPSMSGIDVCLRYRQEGGTSPLLMLTGRSKVEEKSAGLDSGADDYLTKPFDLPELSARIRALLRRPRTTQRPTIQHGDLMLESGSFQVTIGGKPVQLQPREFMILELLMRNPQEVFSPEAILNRLWESDSETTADTIYTLIKTLRKKLGDSGKIIKTVYGAGYRLGP